MYDEGEINIKLTMYFSNNVTIITYYLNDN